MDNIEPDIKDDSKNRIRRNHGSRVLIPLGLVSVGSVLLAHQLGMPVPDWLFSWQVLLITIGIFSGFAHAFRGPGWLIMILIGTFFLMDQLIPGFDLHRFIWPAILVVVGIVMLVRPKKPYWMDDFGRRCNDRDQQRWRRRYGRRGFPAMPGFPGDPSNNP